MQHYCDLINKYDALYISQVVIILYQYFEHKSVLCVRQDQCGV